MNRKRLSATASSLTDGNSSAVAEPDLNEALRLVIDLMAIPSNT